MDLIRRGSGEALQIPENVRNDRISETFRYIHGNDEAGEEYKGKEHDRKIEGTENSSV